MMRRDDDDCSCSDVETWRLVALLVCLTSLHFALSYATEYNSSLYSHFTPATRVLVTYFEV
jgi:hypothetical protein